MAEDEMQAVLTAPVLKDKKVLSIRRDDVTGRSDKDGITSLVQSIVATDPAASSAFHVLDVGKVAELFLRWRLALRVVRPYYAVKCNSDPVLLGVLAALGAGFDCASRAEMETVLALGVTPDRVVFANPCKLEPHIEYAASVGVNFATYDSEEEVAKIKRCHPKCELLLRLKAPDDGDAIWDMGSKYGARLEEVTPLLRAARNAGLAVIGVSFHVGSGVSRVDVYRSAIEMSRAAFDAAAALGMPPMRILDIGGGFKAGGSTFEEASVAINAAVEQCFSDVPGVEVIAEPGRYFSETVFTLAARVIGKRTRGEAREYWIDDGVHGSLSCILLEKYAQHPKPVARRGGEPAAREWAGGETHPSTVFGPTCSALDTVVRGCSLPELRVGDWLVFHDVGAYSTACSSNFNGFSTSHMKTYLAYCS